MGPSPGHLLAAHRADLTLGKTAMCIFVAMFYMLYNSPPLKMAMHDYINPCGPGTPKQVLWQTVKTQMKCRIIPHFIRVYTVC